MISLAEHRAIESEGATTPAQSNQDGKRFADLSTDELLTMAMKTCSRTGWRDWSREMLLAFFHNRHGKFVPAGS